MDIRTAVRECLKEKGLLGRPRNGEKGEAVDLARHFCPSEAKVILALRSEQAAAGQEWKPTPEELLGEWEIVTLDDLRQELLKS